MGDKSAIEWTDATWNPTTGCDRISPGCAHCYALDLAARLKAMGSTAYQVDGDPRTSGPGFGLQLHPERLEIPLTWTRRRRIFVDSMSDLFHPDVPSWFLAKVWRVMARAPQHTFQILTKRPERMRAWVTASDEVTVPTLPNVWLGTSVENARWRVRVDELRETPAAIRFLSCEPLLGPLGELDLLGIDWVIAGGESGPEHRPVKVEWIREIRDQCVDAGVPFLFKQWGGRTSKSGGRELDGRTWDEFPSTAPQEISGAAS